MKQPPLIVVQLFHIKGPLAINGKEAEFSVLPIFIGRHPSCHLLFPTDLAHISRKHAEIIREGNQFKLIDHSTNGTFVNGKKVKEVYLKDGDVLMFAEGGPQVSFLTQMREGEMEIPPAQPPREPQREIRVEPPKREPLRQSKPPVEERPRPIPPLREEPAQVSAQPMKVPLIIQYGPTIRHFKQVPVTIGKSPRCEYVLEHPAILDQHAQIFFSQDQYWIKDLTGQRLVHINRQPIGFQAPLQLNDDLALSPQGPFFRVFGEGRLGESEGFSDEPKGEESPKGLTEAKEPKKGESVFKKFFHH